MAKFEKGNKQGRKFQKGEEQSKLAKLGGIASQKKQHETKMLREVALEKLNEMLDNGKTTQEGLVERAKELALNGKVRLKDIIALLVFLRDTSGQKPVDKIAETDSQGNDLNFKVQMVGIPSEEESDED